MGYIRVEKFDDPALLVPEITGEDRFAVNYTDWDEFLSSGKDKTIRLDFLNDVLTPETYLVRTYDQPIYFVPTDDFDLPVLYPELRMQFAFMPGIGSTLPTRFTDPSNFYFSMSIWRNGVKLREWFLPLLYTCALVCHTFDLKPLIEAGATCYDEMRIHVLKSPGEGSALYIADVYVCQDEVEHDLAVTVTDMLHLKMRKRLTQLADQCTPGDKKIKINSVVDIHENMAIALGDPDNLYELHVLKTAPFQHKGRVDATFTGEYQTETLQLGWPAGTPVWFVVPAEFGELSQSEAVFPMFYFAWEAPEPVEEMTSMHNKHFSNFVRDTSSDANHLVALSIARDQIRIKAQIHVYAPTVAIAVDMWRYLRSVFDNQSHIVVAGSGYDYVVTNYRKVEVAPGENLPHYIMEMDCYPTEFPHKLNYLTFPALKSLTVSLDPLLSSQNAGLVLVDTQIPAP